jgi:hypothetical protein
MLSFRQYIAEERFSGSDIKKREGEYIELVIKRIKEKKPFLFSDKNSEIILYDDNIEMLEKGEDPSYLLKSGNRFIPFFTTVSGKRYRWNDIEKSIFTGSIDRLKKEKIATAKLNQLIANAIDSFGGPITVIIGNVKIENVLSASSEHIKGDPKSDITLMDETDKEIGFISHKADSGAKAFQQYGGVTKKSGRKINSSKLVVDFAKKMKEYFINKSGVPDAGSGDSFFMKIPKTREGRDLAARAVYGEEWDGGKRFSRNSVHCIGQGNPILEKTSDAGVFELKFSHATHYPNDVSWAFSGDYQAVLGARFMRGRGFSAGDVRINNIRPGVFPILYYSTGRKSIEL